VRRAAAEAGTTTLETTLMIVVLLPLLFAILQFGDVFHRWLAQDAATVHAARYAAELGGDDPQVRMLLSDGLRDAGIDPGRVTVEILPSRVRWREPIRVTVRSHVDIAIPFVFSASIPLISTASGRGELDR
jgi:hypothetical protein